MRSFEASATIAAPADRVWTIPDLQQLFHRFVKGLKSRAEAG